MCVCLSLFVLFPWHPLPPRCFLSVSMSNSVRSNLSWEFKHCRCMHTHCQRPTGACYTVSYCENSVCVCVCACVWCVWCPVTKWTLRNDNVKNLKDNRNKVQTTD